MKKVIPMLVILMISLTFVNATIQTRPIILDKDDLKIGEPIKININNQWDSSIYVVVSNGCEEFFTINKINSDYTIGESINLYDQNLLCTQALRSIEIKPKETKEIGTWNQKEFTWKEISSNKGAVAQWTESQVAQGRYLINIKTYSSETIDENPIETTKEITIRDTSSEDPQKITSPIKIILEKDSFDIGEPIKISVYNGRIYPITSVYLVVPSSGLEFYQIGKYDSNKPKQDFINLRNPDIGYLPDIKTLEIKGGETKEIGTWNQKEWICDYVDNCEESQVSSGEYVIKTTTYNSNKIDPDNYLGAVIRVKIGLSKDENGNPINEGIKEENLNIFEKIINWFKSLFSQKEIDIK